MRPPISMSRRVAVPTMTPNTCNKNIYLPTHYIYINVQPALRCHVNDGAVLYHTISHKRFVTRRAMSPTCHPLACNMTACVRRGSATTTKLLLQHKDTELKWYGRVESVLGYFCSSYVGTLCAEEQKPTPNIIPSSHRLALPVRLS